MAASALLRSLSRISRTPATPTAFYHHRAPCSPFSSAAAADAAGRGLAGLGPTGKGEKARVVVLGTGWAGSRLMKDLDTTGYDVVCVSPRNHMVFTPLLASTCVGTLEFRSVAEPLARIQPAVSKSPGSYFLLARCTGVDTDAHTVRTLPHFRVAR
jgi:NADH:ubiquinone reductase (non-electrogenic)